MHSILVSGSLAYDRIMDFPGKFSEHFIPEKLHALSISFAVSPPTVQFGGTAGNIAYNLALLEEKPELLGSVGTDFAEYRTHLITLGVDPDSLQIVPDMPTAGAYIITDTDDNQIAAFSGAAGFVPYKKPVDPRKYSLAIISASCVEDMAELPPACLSAGLPFFYDPGQQLVVLTPEQLIAGITGAAVVFGNDYELKLIEEKTGLDEAGLLTKAKAVVVTYGAEGSRILTSAGELRVPSVHVEKAIDPTGAGDAYRAGFMKGFLAGLPLDACGKVASAVAAYAVERYGTQNHRFTLPEVRERYQNAYGETCPV